MQPELKTDFQMITQQPGNTAIGSKVGSLKRNNEDKSQDKGFLGMLNDMEKIPHENIIDLEKLQEKSQNTVPVVVIKTEQEISTLIGDMALKGENITDVLLGAEQNGNVNEEKQFIPMIAGKVLLKGHINGNEIDKNTSATASKAETESVVKKSALSETSNKTVKTEENKPNTWQEELNKNNTGSQISKGFNKNVDNEVKAQLLNGLEADIAKMTKDTETIGKIEDVQIKHAEAKAQLLNGLEADIAKMTKNTETIGKIEDVQIKHAEAKAQLLNGLEADIAKMTKNTETIAKNADVQIKHAEAKAQLSKGMDAEISKMIKNLETLSRKDDVQTSHVADIKNIKETTAAERILMENMTFKAKGEESKISNRTQIFDDEINESELSKKELLLKIPTGVKEKEQESDLLKRDDTSDKKASQSDKEFINLKEGGLKLKASGSELSAGKMISMEAESKDNGIMLPKNVSGDKSSEEIMFAREHRQSSNISRDGTLNQIVEKAAFSLKNGKTQARVELKPEFLGSVRMKITTENHLVTVRILTELPVVKEMIENNISQLKTDLQSHGLSIDKLDVSVANDSQQHGKGFEKAENLPEQENSDVSDNGAVVAEETGTANLLKESTTENGLDFFA